MYQTKYYDSIHKSLKNSSCVISQSTCDSETFFAKINSILHAIKKSNNKIYFFGNGASAAFANHMALDFSKNGGILSYSLSDSSLLTALSNDYSYDDACVEFLKINKIDKNDLVVTISSSGNSKNIINVIDYCSEKDINTLSLSGLKPDNSSIRKSKFAIFVPAYTYGIVECCHQVIVHAILDKFMGVTEWDRDTYQNMSSEEFNL
jgi:D-sedoheptulose 7-phosphate isomerase